MTTRGKRAANVIVGLSGGLSLVSWAIGITRLPAGSGYESGLWLIALGSLAVLGGLVIDLGLIMRSARTNSQ